VENNYNLKYSFPILRKRFAFGSRLLIHVQSDGPSNSVIIIVAELKQNESTHLIPKNQFRLSASSIRMYADSLATALSMEYRSRPRSPRLLGVSWFTFLARNKT
jgi:hypothetical protein